MKSKRKFNHEFDAGIKKEVEALQSAGIETFESCQGGRGHSSPEAVVRFHGNRAEGMKAVAAAMHSGLSVYTVRRVWRVEDGEVVGPWWEMTFLPK